MKILLTGTVTAFVLDMIRPFQNNDHQLFLLGENLPADQDLSQVTFYRMSPNAPEALRVIEAVAFDTIIFFYSTQREAVRADAPAQGAMLDALLAMQPAAQQSGVSSFVLVTDSRVFGKKQLGLETEQPIPDTAAGLLIKAAEDCFEHSIANLFRSLLVRVTNLYAPQDPASFFAYADQCLQHRQELTLRGSEEAPCDFVRAVDLAEFLCQALDSELSGTAHIFYGKPYTYGDVALCLKEALPGLSIRFDPQGSPSPVLRGEVAHAINWVPHHDWQAELTELLQYHPQEKQKNLFIRAHQKIAASLGKWMPYVEMLLFALLAYGLTLLTGRDSMFRYLNFWLLYTVLIGNLHGIVPGLISAVIACWFYAIDWAGAGNDMYLLIYNVDNWLPLSTYFLGGGIFGYLHDRRSEQLHEYELQKKNQDQENQFLQSIYTQATEDRNRLKEQVVHSRDSYGRIYSITRELDSLQPEQIFLSTLNVIEGVLQNKSVAIYYYKKGVSYARMVLHSQELTDLSNSLDLAMLPELTACINQGKVYANHRLQPFYPSFAAPIMMSNEPLAMIVLWKVPFDQCSLYFQNLFSITCGLAQSAMVRAVQYFRLSPDVYIPDTQILTEKPFRSSLEVYRSLRKRHAGNYLLLRVYAEQSLSIEEYNRRLSRAMRSTDIAGRMDDGSYYALLPQATEEHLSKISARFAAQQLSCIPVEEQECEAFE